jgi:hypothetical protein
MAHLDYWIRYFYFLDYISGQRVHQPDERKNQEMSLVSIQAYNLEFVYVDKPFIRDFQFRDDRKR